MDMKQLRYFVAVAEHLHFSKAANTLGLAQPALSQAIRRLENELGVTLFERSSRSVRLSDMGQALLPRARSLLSHAATSEREIRELAGLQRTRLRVGASGTIAAFMLPDLLRSYRSRFPDPRLEIVQRRTEGVIALVESGELDVGIVRLPFRSTHLNVTPLRTENLFAVLPSNHPMAARKTLSVADLAQDPFIMCVSEAEPFYGVVMNLCAEKGFVPNVISAGAEYTTVFRLVALEMGVSIVSGLATKHVVDPAPAFVRVADNKATSPIVAVSENPEQLSRAVRAFLDVAVEEGGSDRKASWLARPLEPLR